MRHASARSHAVRRATQALTLLVVLLPACSTRDLIARGVPPTVDRFAHQVMHAVATDSGRNVLPLLSPALVAVPGMSDSLRQLSRTMPADGLDTASIVSYTKWAPTSGPTGWRLSYWYTAGSKYVLCELALVAPASEPLQATAIHVYLSDTAVASQNALTLGRASPAARIASMLAAASVGFCLWTAALVLRSRMPKRWLWALLACIGFGRVAIPWHAGTVTEQMAAIQLLGVAVRRDGLIGPWWLVLSFPGGALLALQRLRKVRTSAQHPLVPDGAPPRGTAEGNSFPAQAD
jgi:hypothetical protein